MDNPEIKHLVAYLQRAQEMDKKEPVISYYCRLFALKQAVDLPSKSAVTTKFLMDLMTQLEHVRWADYVIEFTL